MDNMVELAQLFKERDNKERQGVGVGVVASLSPLTISFNNFMLDSERLVIASKLKKEYATDSQTVGNHGSHLHKWSDPLEAGDLVIIIASEDNSRYYVIDKVG